MTKYDRYSRIFAQKLGYVHITFGRIFRMSRFGVAGNLYLTHFKNEREMDAWPALMVHIPPTNRTFPRNVDEQRSDLCAAEKTTSNPRIEKCLQTSE